MAGDNTPGGGGSVTWKIDADKVNKNETSDRHTGSEANGRHEQGGRDQDGELGENFTVSIKVPAGKTQQQFINGFVVAADGSSRVYFNLKIENASDQIRISWGRDNQNVRPDAALV